MYFILPATCLASTNLNWCKGLRIKLPPALGFYAIVTRAIPCAFLSILVSPCDLTAVGPVTLQSFDILMRPLFV